eukprot:TRINITY_DN25306_c0_g1_i1.p1 TRINITY_DN25306_c0_g1~~TRINITY_DN25306_c0_g1_i1.p1  ORF type:complete len:258 (-),score=29.15 TRINITY_DN25306_c0_g1_i1:256-936(-)
MGRRSSDLAPVVLVCHGFKMYVNDISCLQDVLAAVQNTSPAGSLHGDSSMSVTSVTSSTTGSRSSGLSCRIEMFDIFSDAGPPCVKPTSMSVDVSTQVEFTGSCTHSMSSCETQTGSVSCSDVGVGTDMTGDMISGLEHALNKAAEKFVYFSPVTDCIVECNASPADLVKAYKERSARWADISEPESERCDSSTCAPQDAVCSPVGTSEALSDVHLHKKKRGNKKK